jgi:hypothetical protein
MDNVGHIDDGTAAKAGAGAAAHTQNAQIIAGVDFAYETKYF